jgi:hypothetical protein
MINSLLYIDGNKDAYRCNCGCNVFHIVAKNNNDVEYACNACDTRYAGTLIEKRTTDGVAEEAR